MKVYENLSKARVMLQQSSLKKTGKGHGFNYFELSDFLPRINEIFEELKLVSFTSITTETAKMIIASAEDGSTAEFEIPFANFKGDDKRKLQEVQEMGGTITYLTRYLWVQVMNIVEPDTVDRPNQQKTQNTQTAPVRNAQAPVQQEAPQQETPVYDDDKVWWDGSSPLKQFDHFIVDQPDGSQIVYKTMKNKTKGNLFGLAVEPENVSPSLKYYDLD